MCFLIKSKQTKIRQLQLTEQKKKTKSNVQIFPQKLIFFFQQTFYSAKFVGATECRCTYKEKQKEMNAIVPMIPSELGGPQLEKTPKRNHQLHPCDRDDSLLVVCHMALSNKEMLSSTFRQDVFGGAVVKRNSRTDVSTH